MIISNDEKEFRVILTIVSLMPFTLSIYFMTWLMPMFYSNYIMLISITLVWVHILTYSVFYGGIER